MKKEHLNHSSGIAASEAKPNANHTFVLLSAGSGHKGTQRKAKSNLNAEGAEAW
jgi:hypothetical protein